MVFPEYGWNVGGGGGGPWGGPGAAGGSASEAPPSGAYEWRDASFGEVPSDAVRAGVDKSGEPLFVGRAFHEGDVVPAKVVPSHGGAYVPWGGKEHKKDYYEVLCAPHHRLGWAYHSDGHVPYNAVSIGQTQDGEHLYVGRVFHDGTQTPGKVQGSHGCCYIPYAGDEMSFKQYEVLVIH